MPSTSKGGRLWLRKRRGADSTVGHPRWQLPKKARAVLRTILSERSGAFTKYLASKHIRGVRTHSREPDQIPIADVLTIYLPHCSATPFAAKGNEGPRRGAGHLLRRTRCSPTLTEKVCRAYATQRSTDAAARMELEDLRAAINHHRREGLCNRFGGGRTAPRATSRVNGGSPGLKPHAGSRSAWSYREVQGEADWPSIPTARRALHPCGALRPEREQAQFVVRLLVPWPGTWLDRF